MKKMNASLAFAILYCVAIVYTALNMIAMHLSIPALEEVILTSELGNLRWRNLVFFLTSLAFALFLALVYGEQLSGSYMPIFSIALTLVLGFAIMLAHLTERQLNKYVLYAILLTGSIVLEIYLGTLSVKDVIADMVYSYGLMAAFIDLMDFLGIPLVSWDAFWASAFFGIILILLANHCHGFGGGKKKDEPAAQVTKVVVKKKVCPLEEGEG